MRVSNDRVYVEKDCVFEFQGRKFESGGAFVSPEYVIAYPGKDGVLKSWHGKPLGTWKAVASWPVRSYIGSTMYQIEAIIDNIVYTGRGFGEGMLYRGKRKAGK